MKCLVTGASGFVGSSLVNELLNLGFEVVAVSKSGGFTSKGQAIHRSVIEGRRRGRGHRP